MPRATNERTNKSRGQTPSGLNQSQAGRQTDRQWGKVNHSDFRTLTPQLHKLNQGNNNKGSKESEGVTRGSTRESRAAVPATAALRHLSFNRFGCTAHSVVGYLPIKLKWQLARDSAGHAHYARHKGTVCLSVCQSVLLQVEWARFQWKIKFAQLIPLVLSLSGN